MLATLSSPFFLLGPYFSPLTILLILVLVFLFFGGRIPELARSLGRGINEFKKGLKDSAEDDADKKLSRSDEKEKEKEKVS